MVENSLKVWLDSHRRKPMIIRGARQVGKSTLVRLFAEKYSLELIEINMERYLYLDDIFKSFNLSVIIKELEGISGKHFNKNSLLFLDEIQSTPNALACLRYFHEERPDIPVITAGSLLEFTLSNHNFSMPVGRVDYRYLGPMSFYEFILNLYPDLAEYLTSFESIKNISNIIHTKLIEKLKEYFFTGGMPEAILAFKETGNLSDVKMIHRSICDTYIDDFSKYNQKNKNLALLQKIFRSIPLNIGKKVKYTQYSKDHKSKEVRDSLDLLIKAKICNPVYSSDCSGLPLEATISHDTYKLMFLDIGLSNHICGLDLKTISALEEDLLVNKGQIAEQFIGQHLIISEDMTKSFDLNYWLRENKKGNAEVDFVTVNEGKITPIEVKAGKSGALKSLHQFIYQKKETVSAIRFDLNKYSRQRVSVNIKEGPVEYNLESFPLYAVGLI